MESGSGARRPTDEGGPREVGGSSRGKGPSPRRVSGPPLGPLLVALACLAVALPLLFLLLRDEGGGAPAPASAAGLRAGALPEGLAGRAAPAIRLRDEAGASVDTARLAGRPYLVTFLFAECPDVCPLIAQEIGAALAELGPRAREARVIAVSVDPRGDTPEAVRRFRARHDLPAEFRYAIGSEAELRPIWEGYYAAPQLPGRPETSTHTASVWLVDAEGTWRGRYPAGIPIAPSDLAHDLGVLVDEAAVGGPA